MAQEPEGNPRGLARQQGRENRTAFLLPSANAATNRIEEPWEADNEQWWDWYLSLASDEEDALATFAEVPEPPRLDLPDLEEIQAELAKPYPLQPEQRRRFWRDGYIHLSDVLSAGSLLALRNELLDMLEGPKARESRVRFPTAEMMWIHAAISRAFVLSPRIAGIGAQLLGIPAIRLYHDSALCKLPQCGRTPWHYDAHHFPIDTEQVITTWIPLQTTPPQMGSLTLAPGLELWRQFKNLCFSKFDDSYDRTIVQSLHQQRIPVERPTFELGSLSFHHARTLHSAGANRTPVPRLALSTTYFESGAHLIENPTLISGHYEKFMPGIKPGDKIDSPLNPIVWSR
jgi:hypothetical protein